MYKFRAVSLGTTEKPSYSVDKQKEYVRYGVNNLYPQYLLDLSVKSALHTAILDRKYKMVAGNGLTYDESLGVNPKLDKFLKNPNPYETMNELLWKIVNDLEIFGGYYLQVIWNKKGTAIAELYHMPYEKIRAAKMNDKGQIDKYFYNEEWKKYVRWNDVDEYPAFNTEKQKNKVQIFRAAKYKAGSPYYSIPSYIGATLDVETLAEISNFHNNNLKNSFNPGLLVMFRGPEPTEEEMDTIVTSIKTKYAGSNSAGEPMIFFLDTEQQEPTIEQLQASDLDKLFEQLSETSKENVTTAHSIPRIVAGLATEGSLGGSKEIIEAGLIFHNNYIEPEQIFLLKTLNTLLATNKYPELEILNNNPSIVLYSEALLEKTLTQDEIRSLFGYEPLEINEDVVVEEVDEVEEEKPGLLSKIFKNKKN